MALHFISTGIDQEHFAQLLLCYLKCWGASPHLTDNTDIWAYLHDQPDQLVVSGKEAIILMTNETAVMTWLSERPKVDFYWYQCLLQNEAKISVMIERQDKVLALGGKFLYLLSGSLFPREFPREKLPNSIYFPAPSTDQHNLIQQISSWGIHPRIGSNLIKKLDSVFGQLHQIHGEAMETFPVQFDLTPEPPDVIEQILSIAESSGLVNSARSIIPEKTIGKIEIEVVSTVEAVVNTETIHKAETVKNGGCSHWSITLVDNQYLPILAHIDEYNCITEAEIIKVMGSARLARKFTTSFDEYSKLLPFDIKVEFTTSGNRYTKVNR
jgi:hypothetical protein